jgi:hypothetical protein
MVRREMIMLVKRGDSNGFHNLVDRGFQLELCHSQGEFKPRASGRPDRVEEER